MAGQLTNSDGQEPAQDGRVRRSWERSVALNAILAAAVTILVILTLMGWMLDDGVVDGSGVERPETDVAAVVADANTGEGSGQGSGAGRGSGAGPGSGAGTGSGSAGGTLADGDAHAPRSSSPSQSDRPTAPSDAMAPAVAAAPAADAPGPLPIGFTVPDAPEREAAAAAPAEPAAAAAAGNAAGGGSTFMGIEITGRRVVFLVDRSRSMQGPRFERTRDELRRAIAGLPADASFSVIMFGSLPSMGGAGSITMPPRMPRRATPAAKREAAEWLWSVTTEAAGGSHAAPAVQEALRMRPDTIFLLTDGALDESELVEAAFRAGKPQSRPKVHTIAIQNADGEAVLRRIASDNGGTYRLIDRPPQP